MWNGSSLAKTESINYLFPWQECFLKNLSSLFINGLSLQEPPDSTRSSKWHTYFYILKHLYYYIVKLLILLEKRDLTFLTDIWSWIVCDGDVDPEWVESLNSVLDDNRLLSLPSGWRIQFEPNVNFIFETHELTNASPATISRIGIVFLNEEDFNLEHHIQHFCNNLPEEQKFVLEPLINDYFLKGRFFFLFRWKFWTIWRLWWNKCTNVYSHTQNFWTYTLTCDSLVLPSTRRSFIILPKIVTWSLKHVLGSMLCSVGINIGEIECIFFVLSCLLDHQWSWTNSYLFEVSARGYRTFSTTRCFKQSGFFCCTCSWLGTAAQDWLQRTFYWASECY